MRNLYYFIKEEHWINAVKNHNYPQEEREELASVITGIDEKMTEKLKEEHEPKQTILKYEMRDPWGRALKTIEVTDTEGINAFFTNHRVDKTYEYSLDPMLRKKIIELITEYGNKMKSPDFSMEDCAYYDACIYNLFLSDHKDSFYFSFFMISQCDPEQFPNRMMLVSLLSRIFTLLKDTGVDRAFFELKDKYF